MSPVAGPASSESRRSPRRGWVLLLIGLFAVPAMLAAGLWGYAYWANSVPPFRPSLPPPPSPNGYDLAAALFARLPSEPAGNLPRWPEGSPDQLQLAVQPVRPILNDIRSSFSLDWRAGPVLGISQTLPELSAARNCARYFVADAALARHRNDPALAVQRSLDAVELGARLPRGGVMLHALVAAAIHAMGTASIERQGAEIRTTALPLALARVRRIRAAWPPIGEVLEGERLYSLGVITDISQAYRRQSPVVAVRSAWTMVGESGETDWSKLDEALSLWLTPKHRSIENMDRCYRQAIAESRKPLRQRRTIPLPTDPASQLIVPMLPSYENVWWRVHTSLALLETALAVQMHRQEQGRLPSNLAQVSRRWLPKTPLDAWGQPVRYRLQDGEPKIYSLGPDGKDDGARPIEFRRLEAASSGDIVWGTLFPRRR